jgi:K+-sensing histidine kinase KdpD
LPKIFAHKGQLQEVRRMIIDQHSGELSALPAHPRGSIFRIALPILLATT